MWTRRNTFFVLACAIGLGACSSSSNSDSTTADAATETNPFTMPLIASTTPTDGATGVDPFGHPSMTLNYAVNIPVVLDNRYFMLAIVTFELTDANGNVVEAGNPSFDSTDTVASLYLSDMAACNATYKLVIDVKAKESYDDGGSYVDPKFGPVEQTMTVTYTTGTSAGAC